MVSLDKPSKPARTHHYPGPQGAAYTEVHKPGRPAPNRPPPGNISHLTSHVTNATSTLY